MNDPLGPIDDASTPLSEEERQGLIPSYITLRGELNEAEQTNIVKAQSWAFSRKRHVLDQKFLNGLHARLDTDLLLHSIGQDPISWGRTNLVNLGDTRAE